MKFEHIFVPCDFSEPSLNAFDVACDISNRANASENRAVYVVHVYESPYYSVANQAGGLTFKVNQEDLKEIKAEIREQVLALNDRPRAKGVQLYKQLVPDVPIFEFYQHLPKGKTDLIVMGTRGNTGFFHGGLFGTNTEKVIRHSPVPVLSVPGEYIGFSGFKRILFATDFEESLDDIYPHVLDIARLYDAKVSVAVINTRENQSTTQRVAEAYNKLIATYPYANTELLVQNDFAVDRGIETLVELYDIDLVAMLTHGRTGISHLIKGSIAEELSAHLKRPLLTLKNN